MSRTSQRTRTIQGIAAAITVPVSAVSVISRGTDNQGDGRAPGVGPSCWGEDRSLFLYNIFEIDGPERP